MPVTATIAAGYTGYHLAAAGIVSGGVGVACTAIYYNNGNEKLKKAIETEKKKADENALEFKQEKKKSVDLEKKIKVLEEHGKELSKLREENKELKNTVKCLTENITALKKEHAEEMAALEKRQTERMDALEKKYADVGGKIIKRLELRGITLNEILDEANDENRNNRPQSITNEIGRGQLVTVS